MSRGPIIIVGAALAGIQALEGLRAGEYDGDVVLLDSDPEALTDRPPLSKESLRQGDEEMEQIRSREDVTGTLGAELILNERAQRLDLDGHRLHTSTGSLEYSRLILACGVRARRPALATQEQPIYTLRTAADARGIRDRLHAAPEHLVVVGSRFIGSEIAAAARSLGVRTSLVGRSTTPMRNTIGQQADAWVTRQHHDNGVQQLQGEVTDVYADAVALADGTRIDADLVAFGIGGVPATEWLAESGIPLDATGGVICDEYLRAGPDVYAAGDIVSWPSGLYGTRLRKEHWSTASEQGWIAGRNAAGGTQQAFDTVPYMWADIYDQRIQTVGVIDGAEEMLIWRDDDEGHRMLSVFHDGERATAVTGVSMRREVAKLRRHLKTGPHKEAFLEFARSLIPNLP